MNNEARQDYLLQMAVQNALKERFIEDYLGIHFAQRLVCAIGISPGNTSGFQTFAICKGDSIKTAGNDFECNDRQQGKELTSKYRNVQLHYQTRFQYK